MLMGNCVFSRVNFARLSLPGSHRPCRRSNEVSQQGEPGVPGVTVMRADTRTCMEIPGERGAPVQESRPRSLPVPEAPRAVLSCHP